MSVSGEVPDALGRLVRSRVDRLSPGPRQAVVAASVLGAEFGLVALGTVTDLGDGLDAAVSELCSGGLLVELRQFPAPAYRFRHALIQEATYKGLLRDQRRQLHARAAWGLETASVGPPGGGGRRARPPFRHGRRGRPGRALPGAGR